jgi:hypothetical protein
MMADLGFLLSGCAPAEQAARLRELRALALLYFGLRHPVTAALRDAIGDPAMVDRALTELGMVPVLRRRRLLCRAERKAGELLRDNEKAKAGRPPQNRSGDTTNFRGAPTMREASNI